MVRDWANYPKDYRAALVAKIMAAARAGDSIALLGLSGSGKSNLLGFIAANIANPADDLRCVLVDCNRLAQRTAAAFFRQARRALGDTGPADDQFFALDVALEQALAQHSRICLLLDRFDDLALAANRAFFNNLRALRDAYKFQLTYVVATRHPLHALRPLEEISEFSELLNAHVLHIGPLSPSDCAWNVQRYANRHSVDIAPDVAQALIDLSGSYAGLLRGALEAWHNQAAERGALPADLTTLAKTLAADPPLTRRLSELWDDLSQNEQLALLSGTPDESLVQFGLMHSDGQPLPLLVAWLNAVARPARAGLHFDLQANRVTRNGVPLNIKLTPKETALLVYLQTEAGQVCSKDAIIRAVWPEDAVYEKGIRDDSLAQLVRRLREKVELKPSQPAHILTVPGRGYRLAQPGKG